MGRIEPVEQFLVPGSAPAVIQGHQKNGTYAHPLEIIGKHLGEKESWLFPEPPPDHDEPCEKCPDCPARKLQDAVLTVHVQQNPAEQICPSAIGNAVPGRQERVAQEKQRLPQPGNKVQHQDKQSPYKRCSYCSGSQHVFFLPEPVYALHDNAEDNEIQEYPIERKETVGAPQQALVYHEICHTSHTAADCPYPQKIAPAVMRMDEPFYKAEQEQRCRQSAQHGEPYRDHPCELEKVVDMVHHHQNQGNELQGCTIQTLF